MDENILSNLSSEWVAGFSTGESNFFITISGTRVWLRFSIAQDSRDLELLKSLVEFFNCGYIAQYKNRKVCEFIVTKINDIIIKIIPFFVLRVNTNLKVLSIIIILNLKKPLFLLRIKNI